MSEIDLLTKREKWDRVFVWVSEVNVSAEKEERIMDGQAKLFRASDVMEGHHNANCSLIGRLLVLANGSNTSIAPSPMRS